MISHSDHVDRVRLREIVVALASSPRPAGSTALDKASAYVHQAFQIAGWVVSEDPFQSQNGLGKPLKGINLIARHPAISAPSGRVFCVGAHVDSCEETPGADDNASAVAALLEIARLLPEWVAQHRQQTGQAPAIDIELIAFDLEEHGMLGGARHAAECRRLQRPLVGMVSLEMLGYCDHRPGSQNLPPQIEGRYSNVGNFIALVGNQNSGSLLETFHHGFRDVAHLPVETILIPDDGRPIPASRLSDHSPFWDAGYPALMVTDTSFLRNPHYHLASDRPDTLDYEFLERVTTGCLQAVFDLAMRQ